MRAIVLFLVLLAASQVCLTAESAATPQGKNANSKISVTTRLVNVDVVVTDKQGNPVSGLAQKDFTVLDDGKPQHIALFSEASTRAPVKPALTLQPDIYTNLLDQHGGVPPSVTIILLDGLNTALTDQSYARQQILKFLGQLKPQDHVALYTLSTRLRILHDFTTDASSLIAALAQYKRYISQCPDAGAAGSAPASWSDECPVKRLHYGDEQRQWRLLSGAASSDDA